LAKTTQASAPKQKNRRYRNAKVSEYRLRRVVECFARDMNVKDTATATRLSAHSVDAIFMRLRETMRDNGLVGFQFYPNIPQPIGPVVGPKHRGVPEKSKDLYAVEFIHRVLTAQQLGGFEKLSACDPKHIARATRLMKVKQGGILRYAVIEQLAPVPGESEPRTRSFSALEYDERSTILINERKLDPHTAFFRYLWDLLLRYPL